MRIFFSFPYALGRVGVGRTALRQVNGLAALGHEVVVAAPLIAAAAEIASGVRVLETRRISGRRIPQRAFLSPGWASALHDRRASAWLIQEHRAAPLDVLHSWPLAGTRTMRAARERGIVVLREAPNTHTGHAYDVVEREAANLALTIPIDNSHHRDPDHLAREEREWELADAILAPSAAVEASFLERGFSSDRLLRHRYGCDLGAAPSMAPRSGRPLRALFLGAAEPRKGLHHALEAWSRSQASRTGTLRIAGRFMPGYRECIAEHLNSSSVEELGFVEDPQALLADADVLLLPSVEEGSAIVTYEAQAVGCIPLVSWQAGAFLEPDVHGLVHDAGDIDELVRHLDAIDRDDALRERLRAACLSDRERLGWDAAALTLESVYLAAVERRRVSR